jgi:hypothetical protein
MALQMRSSKVPFEIAAAVEQGIGPADRARKSLRRPPHLLDQRVIAGSGVMASQKPAST